MPLGLKYRSVMPTPPGPRGSVSGDPGPPGPDDGRRAPPGAPDGLSAPVAPAADGSPSLGCEKLAMTSCWFACRCDGLPSTSASTRLTGTDLSSSFCSTAYMVSG